MDTITLELKADVLALAREKLQQQLLDIKEQLVALQSSSEGEEKSSAGDKYETQREMIKQSRQILDVQLSRVQVMANQLNAVPLQALEYVQEGALVKLPIGWVWVSVSLGEVVCKGLKYQLISKDSPLFLAIKGLKKGGSMRFRGQTMTVEEVL